MQRFALIPAVLMLLALLATPAAADSAPGRVTVDSGKFTVTLTWNGGDAPFTVLIDDESVDASPGGVTPTNGRGYTFTHDNLSYGDVHTYTVVDADGDTSQTITASPLGQPDDVANLEAVRVGPYIRFTWDDNPDDGGSPIAYHHFTIPAERRGAIVDADDNELLFFVGYGTDTTVWSIRSVTDAKTTSAGLTFCVPLAGTASTC